MIGLKSESVSPQLYLTLCDPMDCSLLGFSVHEILQARILWWTAIPFSRGLPNLGIKPGSPILQRFFFYHLSHQGSPPNMEHFTNLHVILVQGP